MLCVTLILRGVLSSLTLCERVARGYKDQNQNWYFWTFSGRQTRKWVISGQKTKNKSVSAKLKVLWRQRNRRSWLHQRLSDSDPNYCANHFDYWTIQTLPRSQKDLKRTRESFKTSLTLKPQAAEVVWNLWLKPNQEGLPDKREDVQLNLNFR